MLYIILCLSKDYQLKLKSTSILAEFEALPAQMGVIMGHFYSECCIWLEIWWLVEIENIQTGEAYPRMYVVLAENGILIRKFNRIFIWINHV